MSYVYFVQRLTKVSAPVASYCCGQSRTQVSLGDLDETTPVKIGFTTNLRQRAVSIAGATQTAVVLVAAFRGTLADERRLHAVFAHLRGGGCSRTTFEWFRPAWELGTFVASLPCFDIGSAYGDWRPQPYARFRRSKAASAVQRLLQDCWQPRLADEANEDLQALCVRLEEKIGAWVTPAGLRAVAAGRYAGPRMRAALAEFHGIPISDWDHTSRRPVLRVA